MTTEMRASLPILAFPDVAAFETWLADQAPNAAGLWLRLAKKGAAEPTLSKADGIDAALCHGWIDGQLDKYDAHYWLIRFTPRKPRSKWSEVNRTRATQLSEEGRMRPAGLAQIEAAKKDGRWESAYAPASTIAVPSDLEAALAASRARRIVLRDADRRQPLRDPLPDRRGEAGQHPPAEDRSVHSHA